jgi:pimeloyl-ACP methyl ester carboxylesterase
MEVGQHNNMDNFTSNFLEINNIKLHFLHYPNADKPIILLLHGLTANCHAFEGLVNNGLNNNFELIIPDLRGRGLSSHPAFGYSFKLHAEDIIGLIKPFTNREIILVGHSFGGLLSSYLCYYYPNYFSKIIFLDAAPEMNSKTPLMLQTSMGRLDKKFENKEAYFQQVKNAPYVHFWDNDMQTYYDADIDINEDGTVESKSDLAQIIQIATHVSKEPFAMYFSSIKKDTLLISADGEYNLSEPILPRYLARKAVNLLKKGELKTSEGNHHTMLYGEFASEIVNWINQFLAQ